MDANRGIMLAHKMNGEALTPDHGKPLRAVVPGQIGGRSVKWLKRIIITSEPSDNWYHIYDNRVLPTTVSPEESAQNPKWWTDERYAIYDLSPNSAIAFPAHGEQLSLAATPSYNIRGYAYSGGGRRITRCEVSLDKGKTWRLAKIEYAEDRYRAYADRDLFGGRLDMDWRETSFCWCFWSLGIDTAELAVASDVLVRAMDESMCIQPRDMYWSVLGMMNNPWYRIAIHHEPNSLLRFEHPTQPALIPGGWMERVKKEGGDLTNGCWGEKTGGKDSGAAVDKVEDVKMTKDGVDKIIELDELRAHDNDVNPWFVVNGHVYDGTAFLSAHPGGAQSIVSAAATDATDDFVAIHSETAKAMMPAHHIGRLSPSSLARLTATESTSLSASASISPDTPFLSPRTWRTAHLTTKTPVSSDTHIYTFTLPHPTQSLGLPTGQHLLLRLPSPSSNTPLIRPYTPISPTSDPGAFSLIIKTYPRPTSLPTSLAALPLGAPVSFKGPLGSFTYARHGAFHLNGIERNARRFVMLCAGTGIAPVLGVLRAVLQDESDPTTCVVLDCNRSEADILCRAELQVLVARSQGRGRVEHVLSCAGETWEGRTGRVCGELMEEICGVNGREDSEGTVVLVCGPPGWEECVRGLLKERGWKGDDVVFF
jgi:nitrate reductase (NAD(P)H)